MTYTILLNMLRFRRESPRRLQSLVTRRKDLHPIGHSVFIDWFFELRRNWTRVGKCCARGAMVSCWTFNGLCPV